jgi:hypothetical protein
MISLLKNYSFVNDRILSADLNGLSFCIIFCLMKFNLFFLIDETFPSRGPEKADPEQKK